MGKTKHTSSVTISKSMIELPDGSVASATSTLHDAQLCPVMRPKNPRRPQPRPLSIDDYDADLEIAWLTFMLSQYSGATPSTIAPPGAPPSSLAASTPFSHYTPTPMGPVFTPFQQRPPQPPLMMTYPQRLAASSLDLVQSDFDHSATLNPWRRSKSDTCLNSRLNYGGFPDEMWRYLSSAENRPKARAKAPKNKRNAAIFIHKRSISSIPTPRI